MVLEGVVKDVKTEVLFAEIRSLLLQGRQVKMRVRGRSMRPMLEHHRDSVVLQRFAESSYRCGDIVLAYTLDGRWMLHRIIACNDSDCWLQGDGNIGSQEQCKRTDILGKVVQFQRKSKLHSATHWFWQLYARLWTASVVCRRPLLFLYEGWHRVANTLSLRK